MVSSLFQSTRPRGARHEILNMFQSRPVSIHAPARGATDRRRRTGQHIRFNPRARAGRDEAPVVSLNFEKFQSTRPRGARLHAFDAGVATNVSIHAPARGATYPPGPQFLFVSFNPRARAGRDVAVKSAARACLFQSTRPRGARLSGASESLTRFVSIHAPARGATGQCESRE